MDMNLKIIRDQDTYKAYLTEYETYFDKEPVPGSAEGDRFEMLGVLLAKYEESLFDVASLTPLQSILFTMERLGFEQSDLARLLGSRSRASELLSGRRNLTLDQIRLLHSSWHIPADLLVGTNQVDSRAYG